jgi:CDP-diacylglycerol pyrophosphatase
MRSAMTNFSKLAAYSVAVIVQSALPAHASENPNVLWTIVQSCAAQQRQGRVPPGACAYVDLKDEVAIIKSPEGRWQYLAVPTVRVTGIEDPQVLTTRLPNYWALAWSAAGRVLPSRVMQHRLHIGLAINSVEGRSQDQLHIHISCVRRDIVSTLYQDRNAIGTSWSQPMMRVGNHDYKVMLVESSSLAQVDPFFLILKISGAREHMAEHTIVVTGATWDGGKKNGFYVLDDYAHNTSSGRDFGHGEELLDENCSEL